MGRRVHCGTCGSDNLASASDCWFCGDAIAMLAANTPGGRDDPARPAQWSVGGTRQVGLAVLSLVAVSLCAGAFWLSIGHGIATTFFIAPALMQTAWAVERAESRGRRVSIVQKTGAFVRSLMIGVAARAAGLATFMVALMIGLAAGNLLALAFGHDWLLKAGGLAGALIGALAGFLVAMRINRQRLSV